MTEILTKTQYAARRGKSPTTVSRWIARQQLTMPALRSDGMIDVGLADEQLSRTTILQTQVRFAKRALPPSISADKPANWSPVQRSQAELLAARALSATVAAERARRELDAERGIYVRTADMRAEFAAALARHISGVEQSLTDLAIDLRLDREQVNILRRWWRNCRQKTADSNRLDRDAVDRFTTDTAA